MIEPMCRSGLLTIILMMVLSGALTSYASPLVEREGMAIGHSSHEAFGSCKDGEIPPYAGKRVPGKKTCRLDLLTKDRSVASLSSWHNDPVWGDRFNQSQLTVDDSVQCFSESRAVAFPTTRNCILMGAPWLHAVTAIPTISDTYQSLFEFELVDPERNRLGSHEVILSYRGLRYSLGYKGTRFSEDLEFANSISTNSTMRLLGNNAEEYKNFRFTDNDYKVEASDTITRFIPITTRPFRNLEMGDLISILLLVLILPDYRKLKLILGNVFVRKTFKC